MKRIIAGILCVALMLMLCSCSMANPSLRYARKCWNRVGDSRIDVDEIYIMKYTSRTYLSEEVPETDIYDDIPSRGYAILFNSHDGEIFMDYYACFLDEDGDLEFTFDYEENYDLYEANYANFSIYNIEAGERALEYLTNCNYFSSMLNAADGDAPGMILEKNTWYCFSNSQIRWAAN